MLSDPSDGKHSSTTRDIFLAKALVIGGGPGGCASTHFLTNLGHEVTLLRNTLPCDSPDGAVLQFAYEHGCVLLTCNRDDFLHLAAMRPHHGIVVVIRRRTRAGERAALFRLLERAGQAVCPDKDGGRGHSQVERRQHGRGQFPGQGVGPHRTRLADRGVAGCGRRRQFVRLGHAPRHPPAAK